MRKSAGNKKSSRRARKKAPPGRSSVRAETAEWTPTSRASLLHRSAVPAVPPLYLSLAGSESRGDWSLRRETGKVAGERGDGGAGRSSARAKTAEWTPTRRDHRGGPIIGEPGCTSMADAKSAESTKAQTFYHQENREFTRRPRRHCVSTRKCNILN